MNAKVLLAVFKRNFVSYFANPTGYVFICVFVLLSAFAAFWPDEFFNTNLANLDQLNKMFPFIMLVFIPAITMAVWADERRQGTDELLLTIPAGDFDIVLGKYLAAVAIYTVSLLFSLLCNYAVLQTLGNPDVGLFIGTYAGYWMIGLAMLAVGMVASFLTANLTVAYILAAVFNAPLVFAAAADSIMPPTAALAVKQWSIGEQFVDFGRGILSLGGVAYFLTLVAVTLYLCMVLIGRRHWVRGRHGYAMASHYAARTFALVVIAVSVIVFFHHYDARLDVTSEKLSSLSPDTVRLLKNLRTERPVRIEAFISPEVPESYVQTRLDLLSMLRELDVQGGDKVRLRKNETRQFSEEAARAEERYGITPRRVTTTTRGVTRDDQLFMGVAFTCGLEKVILPFIDRGIPVEYELVRSLCTVTQQKRKRIGVLRTDARLYGGFDFQSGSTSSNWPIIEELEKQYEVEEVDPMSPITEKYDALLAVQPSSLGPEEMDHFIEAVTSGQPTAIFEDPLPIFADSVPATSAPRRPPGGMNPMMMGQRPPEKGDITPLWAALGIDFAGDQIIWQDYNPFPKVPIFEEEEFVFVEEGSGANEPFNGDNPISSKLQRLLFPFPGSFVKLNASDPNIKFTWLAKTGELTGTVRYWEALQPSFFGGMGPINPNRRQVPTNVSYVLAAQIQGKLPPKASEADEENDDEGGDGDGGDGADEEPQQREVNVVLVADVDVLHAAFFRVRALGPIEEAGIHFDFDNVTFVLNVLDVLAGDERFLDLRKRRPKHRTLSRIDEITEGAREEAAAKVEELRAEFDEAKDKEEKRLDDRVKKLEEQMKKEHLDLMEIGRRVAMAQQDGERRMQATLDRLEQKRDADINKIETDLSLAIQRVQDRYKMWAVVLPPIPPLVVAVVVFFTRRRRERLSVERSRLRS